MLKKIIFIFFIFFQLSFSSEVFLEKITLKNINTKYKENIKEFILNSFNNVNLRKTEGYKYKIKLKISMLANIFNTCLEVYPYKEEEFYIKCRTSMSLEEIPDTIKNLFKDFAKEKKTKSKKIDLIIYINKNYKFNNIYILSNRAEIIIFDRKITKNFTNNKKAEKVLKIYPKNNEYNLFYLNKEDTLKILKYIFRGYKIKKIYLMEIKDDSSNSASK